MKCIHKNLVYVENLTVALKPTVNTPLEDDVLGKVNGVQLLYRTI